MVIKTKYQSLLGADRTLFTQKFIVANAYIKKKMVLNQPSMLKLLENSKRKANYTKANGRK